MKTRESRRVDATNARFETRVQAITREERGRGRGFRVALTREEHRRGNELRVASIQEHEGRVIQMSRTQRFMLRNCLDAGRTPRVAINKRNKVTER